MRRSSTLVFWLIVLCLASCKDASSHGGLMLVFRSNMIAGKDFSTIRVQVLHDNQPVFDQTYPVGKEHEIPATLAVVGKDAAEIVTVRAAAIAADNSVRVVREAITTIPDHRVAVLEMYLDWLCVGKVRTGPNGPESSCPEGNTCSAGACVDAHLGSDALPDFQSETALGVGGPATTCFDVLACFARSTAVSVDAACSFAAPQGVTTLNVGLLFPFQPDSAGTCDEATGCIVLLEANSPSGFKQADGRIVLAQEICPRLASGAIQGIVVSLACPSKSSTLPICGTGIHAILDAASEMPPTTTVDASVDAAAAVTDAAVVVESGPPCIPQGSEDCFNGIDDDCNGHIDCDDDVCQPTTECVDDAPAPFVPGVQRLGALACPTDYPTATALVGSITGAGCTCGCASHSILCNMNVGFYFDAMSCAAGGSAVLPDHPPTATCQQAFDMVPSVYGVDLTMTPYTPCTVDRVTGDKVPYASMSAKFCSPKSAGAGCAAGSKCLPKQPSHCILSAGKATCPQAFPVGSTWYKGVSDTRACGACTCNVTGANCNAYGISYGTDFGCPPTTGTVLGPGVHCFGVSSYAPGYQLAGTPSDGVCAGASAQSAGKVEGTEEQTLCCR